MFNPFGEVMKRDRCELFSSFLHFNDNERHVARGEEGYGPLHNVKPLLTLQEQQCQHVYQPWRYLALGERMVKFKGTVHVSE